MEIKTACLLLCSLGTRFLESTHSYVSDIENTRYLGHTMVREANLPQNI